MHKNWVSEPIFITLIAIICILLLWQAAWHVMRIALRALRMMRSQMRNSDIVNMVYPLQEVFATKFPKAYAFLQARLNPLVFTGLPLTLLAIAALYVASLLGGVIEELLEAEEMIAWDLSLNAALNNYRTSWLVDVFAWITKLGDFPTLAATSVVATGFLWAHRRVHLVLPLWVTVLGAELTAWAGKFGFDRARPDFLTSVTAISPSFPSGHATSAMAIFGFIAYAIARDLTHQRQRFEIVYWTAVLVLSIGFSRIFLSVHYVSDVAAGFLVGSFWLLVGFAIAEYRRPEH